MQQKTALTIVVAVGILIIVLAVVLFLVPRLTPPEVQQLQESGDAVQELTEGTTASDIEEDLGALLQEEQVLGDLEAQLQQMQQELESEGL